MKGTPKSLWELTLMGLSKSERDSQESMGIDSHGTVKKVKGTPKSLWGSVNRHFGQGKGYLALRKKQVPFSMATANEAPARVFL